MTELEVLDRDKTELKETLRIAWRDLTDPSLTNFQRREIRNQIKQLSSELRDNLKRINDRLSRPRNIPSEDPVSNGFGMSNFRILA